MIILINNRVTLKKNASISLFSEAFLYGYGVFETLRTYNKKPFMVKEHLNRLFKSAKIIHLKINYTKSNIEKMIENIAKKSPYLNQRIKIIATNNKLIVFSIKLKKGPDINKGIKCQSIVNKREMPEVKSLSFLSSFVSHKNAVENGFYEAILIDKNGEVYECAYANLFWFEGNILCTRKEDVLKGITADFIIKLSPYKIKYKKIKIKELIKKREIFSTSSTYGIIPITNIDNNLINHGIVGEKTKKLIELYEKTLIDFTDIPIY